MATSFPFNLATLGSLKNASLQIPRFNFKSDGTYSITQAISVSGSPLVIQGYGSSPGDGTKATIDAGNNAIAPLTLGTTNICGDLIIQNNGVAGTSDGLTLGSSNYVFRVVVNNIRGNGIISAANCVIIECEAYSCNKSNTAGSAGFQITASNSLLNCISHDNSGSNNDGIFIVSSSNVFISNCISETNGRFGLSGSWSLSNGLTISQCDFYNNGSDAIKCTQTTSSATATIRNCNFIKNAGWAINSSLTTGHWYGLIQNCGFGSGTQANGSGDLNGTDAAVVSGSVTYRADITPWVDPENGDFRINLAAAKMAGRGTFTQTASGYSGSVGYPDIGAAQHYDSQKASTFGG